MDQGFPVIVYDKNLSFKENGRKHGEKFCEGIKSLAKIRKELMLAKSPHLENHLTSLAEEQLKTTKSYAPHLYEEMIGIAEGAGISLEEIVILNNYTDFRDLEMPEEGCTTIHIKSEAGNFAGQTWDMHASAKDYLCLIKVPSLDSSPPQLILTLVGCVGLMGINSHGLLVGVNNINTKNAKAGIIWPALVRRLLDESKHEEMENILRECPVTSGHNYLLSSSGKGQNWEVTPEFREIASEVTKEGVIFHTNHCMAENVKSIEDSTSLSSTTHARHKIMETKSSLLNNLSDLHSILTDHDEYPKSICSHYESGAQDPSFTCGGGIADLDKKSGTFWRGCPTHDNNYKRVDFSFSEGDFNVHSKE